MVYITTPTKTVAKELGRLLLENRLAACVNILDGMESMYWWKGELVEEQECVLLVKTHYSRIKKLTTLVNKHHPYECPCIISYTIMEDEGNVEYRDWLYNESLAKN